MSFLALLACCLVAPLAGAAKEQEWVILIHGLGRSSLSMKRLEWDLRGASYGVVNVRYSSRGGTIAELAERHLTAAVASIPRGAKIHFVTHSMGGILVREYLAKHEMTNLGRVVMLAPPNHGSEIVDRLRRCGLGRAILGPAGRELGTAESDPPQQLGPVHGDVGVIAGMRARNPFFAPFVPCPSDGTVSVASARIAGMRDFIMVPVSHTWIMWSGCVLREVRAYLKAGRFTAVSST